MRRSPEKQSPNEMALLRASVVLLFGLLPAAAFAPMGMSRPAQASQISLRATASNRLVERLTFLIGTDDEREDVSRPLELLLLIGLEMPFPVFLNCIRWWLPPAVPFSPDLPCLSSSPPSLPLLASTLPLSTLPLLQPPLKDDSPFRGELPDEPLASSG